RLSGGARVVRLPPRPAASPSSPPAAGAPRHHFDTKVVDRRWITCAVGPILVDDRRCPARRRAVAYAAARRGRTILTAAIASTPTCRGGSFGPFHARRVSSRP